MKWWVLLPVMAVVAFFAFGALTPQYKIDAIQLRKACETMIGADSSRQRECDKIYSDAITRGLAAKR